MSSVTLHLCCKGPLCNSVFVPVLSVQQKQQLDAVAYSSRFAVALFFSPDVVFSFPWAARYVTDSSCIRYITVDSRKRNAGLFFFIFLLSPFYFISSNSETHHTVLWDVPTLGECCTQREEQILLNVTKVLQYITK